jgi:hypothetical protein
MIFFVKKCFLLKNVFFVKKCFVRKCFVNKCFLLKNVSRPRLVHYFDHSMFQLEQGSVMITKLVYVIQFTLWQLGVLPTFG